MLFENFSSTSDRTNAAPEERVEINVHHVTTGSKGKIVRED